MLVAKKVTQLSFIAIAAASLLITGCATGKKKGAEPVKAEAPVYTAPSTDNQSAVGRPIVTDPTAGLDLSKTTVYFEFDSSTLTFEGTQVVDTHAKNLSAKPALRVRLEGHADERGTREYNIGLGERRAQEVAQALQLRGVALNQISIVSYGEERPVASGHSEADYQLNRRVEINYQ